MLNMVLSQITIRRPPPPQKKELTIIFIEPTFQTILGRKKMLELFFKCWKKNVVAIFFFNIFYLSDLKKNCAYVAYDFKKFFLLRKKCLKNLVGTCSDQSPQSKRERSELQAESTSLQKNDAKTIFFLGGDYGWRDFVRGILSGNRLKGMHNFFLNRAKKNFGQGNPGQDATFSA